MNDGVQVTLSGDKDIKAAFADLRDYLPKNALRTAVLKAAQFLQGFIVLMAPKLAHSTSERAAGQLARNIEVHTHSGPETIRGRVTVNTVGKANDPENAFYWRFLEEGFHTKKGDFRRYPFIAPIFDSKNVEAAQIVVDSVDQAIDRAEKKAQRA